MIAVLLVCTVGFATAGQSTNKEPDSGDVDNNTDDTDENIDGNTPDDSQNSTLPPLTDENQQPQEPENKPPEIEIPKFINSITGLETTQESASAIPLGFVVNPELPLYGISSSDLTFEFPIENGTTRLLTYTTDYTILWKVGSIMPTRDFISSTSNFFGGVIISYGNDDVVKYSAWDTSKINLDISKLKECYYIENTMYIYTSEDMVSSAVNSSPQLDKSTYKSTPYSFVEEGQVYNGTTPASTVFIPFAETSTTELYYSESTDKYLYFKSGERKIDMLNGKNITFTNVFILFANATTYEKADGTELVMDTVAGGSGYYISHGTLTEIRWSVGNDGSLQFKTLDGAILSANRGNAYVAYYKASRASNITFN
jgi:hypothetical protein